MSVIILLIISSLININCLKYGFIFTIQFIVIIGFICLSSDKYIFVENELKWEDANDYCLSKYGTYLATIITDDDLEIANEIFNLYADGAPIWIGLTDKFNEGVWKWIDGTSCNYSETRLCIDDKHWYTSEPNDYGDGEDFAALRYYGLFNDFSDRELMFLCNDNGTYYTQSEIKRLEGFELCNKLSEYGCNLYENPLTLRTIVENSINNFTLPTDPCLFDTIDIDWIFEQIPDAEDQMEEYLTHLHLEYQLPCQILVQIEDLLISNDIQYLIDYDYWFVNAGGECDTNFPNENPYGTVVIPCSDNCTDSWHRQYARPADVFSRIFGFKIANISDELEMIAKMILFLNTFQFQCVINTTSKEEYHFCDITNLMEVNECMFDTKTNESMLRYGVMIENYDDVAILEIEQVVFIDGLNNITFEIDTFCFEQGNNCMETLIIVNNETYYIPFNQSY